MLNKYKITVGAEVGKNCDVSFSINDSNELHIKIKTFSKNKIVLSKTTLDKIIELYEEYKLNER